MKMLNGISSLFFVLPMLFTFNVEAGDMKKRFKKPGSVKYPATNKYSKVKEDLGRMLFFDPRLSKSNWISCATCHNPGLGWEDGLQFGLGHGMKSLGRNTPTILNLADATKLFWDGRATSLEEQALGPIESPGEMNQNLDELVVELKAIDGYKRIFKSAFGKSGISKKNIGKAIATFERTIISGEAPFDKFINGDKYAISGEAKKGFKLFNGKAKCVNCHDNWNFSDHSFHDIGIDDGDIGRGNHLNLRSQQHAFKTPGLRNITERAPYMHNGSEKTLADVVKFYNRGGDKKRKSLSNLITPLNLTKKERKQLVIFLHTLTSVDKPQTIPMLPQNK